MSEHARIPLPAAIRPSVKSWVELARVVALKGRDQQLFAAVVIVALIALLTYCGRTGHWGAESIELERQPAQDLSYRIELNSASWVEWSQLPGIGPVLGKRIVDEREGHGPFSNVEDLTRVRGLGVKRISAIAPFIRLDTPGALEAGGPQDPARK